MRKVPYVEGIPQIAQLTTSTYDKFNQLTVTTTSEGTSITNTYNGEGLRVVKQVDSQITIYIYEGDKVVLELDGTENQTARNVRGTNLISRTVDSTTLYYMYNGHADVTALIDAAGTIQATYYYDAFGNIMESTGNVNNPFTYAGYQYDKESNYYYLNARFYDPVTARFLSEDTYTGDKKDPLSLNLYTYCHNEPLMYSDPTGHSWLSTAISVGKSIIKAIGVASKDKKGNSHSSSKGSSGSGGVLSKVVNTISGMLFGNTQSSRNNTVQRPTPSILILKLASNINYIPINIAKGTGQGNTINSKFTFTNDPNAGRGGLDFPAFPEVSNQNFGFVDYTQRTGKTSLQVASVALPSVETISGAASATTKVLGKALRKVIPGGAILDFLIDAEPTSADDWDPDKETYGPPERGLAPDSIKPPGYNSDWTIGDASRPSEAGKGGKSYYDPDGGEWRYFPGDNYHYPHWDHNPHSESYSPWGNVPLNPGGEIYK